jgi:glycosyltransferase involved in cell wall biosynthesis
MPRVTIAFPTYNGARHLAGAIEGALAQTYPAAEIIVVDDGSADETLAVASRFSPRVAVYRNEKNRGIGGNWNRCVALSRGADYLLIAHQDDRMAPVLVERALVLLEREPKVGFVHSNIEQIDDEGRVIGGHWVRDHTREVVKEDFVRPGTAYFERLMTGTTPICCPTVVARRALYDEVGLYDETYTYAVDIQMYLRMLLAADVGYLAEPLYQWRRHPGQTTSRHKKGERYEEIIRAKRDGLGLAEKSGKFDAPALARLRAGVARDCAECARRFALGDPPLARRNLHLAWRLHRGAALSEDFLVGALRAAWAGLFGATEAGRARAERAGVS